MRLDFTTLVAASENRRLRGPNGDQGWVAPRTNLRREPALGAGAHVFLKQLSSSAREKRRESGRPKRSDSSRQEAVIDDAVTLTELLQLDPRPSS